MKLLPSKSHNLSIKSVSMKNSAEKIFDSIYTKKSKWWSSVEEKKFFSVFKSTAESVVAYKAFLEKATINPKMVTALDHYKDIPVMSKRSYLRAYPWHDLCKKNTLSKTSLVMTATSGSTGAPFYFPRTSLIDHQSSIYHEMFLRSARIKKNEATLVIDCFGMGVWIGGLITYQAFKYISERGYPLTIITPGISKHEIFQALKNIGPHYKQIILCGYPPFMKDVIDHAEEHGVSWKNHDVKIIFAAESFSETFRDYFVKKIGIKNMYRDTMNIYGSADLGTMAQETPLCILIRRLAVNHPHLYLALFGQTSRLPTLAQYIPEFVAFEERNGSVYCTGDNVLPLVRYEIGDNGAVFSYNEIQKIFKEAGFDLPHEIQNAGLEDTITELPFVCVYERSDFSTSFYGALIYPEFIKNALSSKELDSFVTGKFTMYTKNDEKQNQYLEINIELKPELKLSQIVKKKVLLEVHKTLVEKSTEYKKIFESLGVRAHPKIIFWSYGHQEHFSSGGKQRWVKK